MELSKINQYTALTKNGIRTPKTIGAVGTDQIIQAAERLGTVPFITKHNRAGKGLGVQLFQSVDSLKAYILSEEFEESIDGITLIQEYIQSEDSFGFLCVKKRSCGYKKHLLAVELLSR
ncbi:hypothetical protein CWS20_18975 [Cytobacillus horneckiae]|uniref:ATP-grasp fold RimK-type domain-containing protein n=1 Tax=Cytobacillus horneckiae TaxID=549687 RepID=A0A2N0ZD81_9BACI|nr:hypothetical protein CWS20_18975 [Cytobacillus horneckiae]